MDVLATGKRQDRHSVPRAPSDREESRCGEMVNLAPSGRSGDPRQLPRAGLRRRRRLAHAADQRRGAAAVGRAPEELAGRTLWESYPDLRGTVVEHELTRALETRACRSASSTSTRRSTGGSRSTPPRSRTGCWSPSTTSASEKRAQRRSAELAAEQAALARIADADRPLGAAAARSRIVAEEAARLTDIEACTVVQFTGPGHGHASSASPAAIPNPLLPSGDGGARPRPLRARPPQRRAGPPEGRRRAASAR